MLEKETTLWLNWVLSRCLIKDITNLISSKKHLWKIENDKLSLLKKTCVEFDSNERIWIERPFQHSIKTVAIETQRFIAIDVENNIFTWGLNRWGELCVPNQKNIKEPTRITNPGNVKIKQVAFSYRASFLLSEDGYVFSAGSNDQHYYLGDPTLNTHREYFAKIPNLEKIKKIAASSWFACALSEEGTLYGWGKNKFSQFPFDSKTTANSKPPTKLFLGLNEIIIDVQLGVFDIYCLTSNVAFLIKTVESGKVVTWACKALSLMSSENVHVPTFVKLDDTIAQMYVTPESVILTGYYIGWGSNEGGQLSSNRNIRFAKPFKLSFSTLSENDRLIVTTCGLYAITPESGDLYVQGRSALTVFECPNYHGLSKTNFQRVTNVFESNQSIFIEYWK